MGLDHPLIGAGPNLYYEYSPRYAFPIEKLPVRYGRIARKPHNEYLKAWAEGGIWGATVILIFLLITSHQFLGAWRRIRPGPALAVAVLLFQALFHDINEVFALTSDSGKRFGVMRFTCDINPSSSMAVSIRTSAPNGSPWCGPPVATYFDEPE